MVFNFEEYSSTAKVSKIDYLVCIALPISAPNYHRFAFAITFSAQRAEKDVWVQPK